MKKVDGELMYVWQCPNCRLENYTNLGDMNDQTAADVTTDACSACCAEVTFVDEEAFKADLDAKYDDRE